MWERNGPFTDAAKTTEGTNPHNGTNQQADFRLIRPAPRQGYQIATRTTRQTKKKERATSQGTKEPSYLRKNSVILWTNRDHSRKVKDNSEDKIRYITSDFKNRRLQILQDPMNSAHEKQGSKEERGHG